MATFCSLAVLGFEFLTNYEGQSYHRGAIDRLWCPRRVFSFVHSVDNDLGKTGFMVLLRWRRRLSDHGCRWINLS
jgi:hypothetical protein